ncbi:MAG: lytic transglycosylase domain-containing protein [Bdellovibrionota bacterium]
MFGARATAASLILCALLAPILTLAAEPVAQVTPIAPAPPAVTGYGQFVLDAKLEPRVRFWVDIYAKYHTWEALIVDIKYPQLIFSVIDTRDKPGAIATEKRKVAAALRLVASKWDAIESGKFPRASLKPVELKIVEAAEKTGLGSELKPAADDPLHRLRTQNGLRDALEDSLFVSGKYLLRMQALFTRFRLPEEIAYLPFVESGFNKHAVSKVGASGIWQFMPYTGKLYLRVDDVVDERNDPMRATEAAARLMKQNYDLLGDWPLAITAYNHGTTGVAKAARDTGSRQISDIIDKYDNKNFGFASQNFYACFLAALHVAKNSETYLGVVPRAKKLEFDEFVMPDFMALKDFLARMEIDETVFRELNPALTEDVYSGKKFVPVGYTVRVPMEASVGFLGRYELIPAELKFREQKGAETHLATTPVLSPGAEETRAPAGSPSEQRPMDVGKAQKL